MSNCCFWRQPWQLPCSLKSFHDKSICEVFTWFMFVLMRWSDGRWRVQFFHISMVWLNNYWVFLWSLFGDQFVAKFCKTCLDFEVVQLDIPMIQRFVIQCCCTLLCFNKKWRPYCQTCQWFALWWLIYAVYIKWKSNVV